MRRLLDWLLRRPRELTTFQRCLALHIVSADPRGGMS